MKHMILSLVFILNYAPAQAAYHSHQGHQQAFEQPLLLDEHPAIEILIAQVPAEQHNARREHREGRSQIDIGLHLFAIPALFLISALLGYGGGIFNHCQCK